MGFLLDLLGDAISDAMSAWQDFVCRITGHVRWRGYPSGRREQRLMTYHDRLHWVCWRCRKLHDAGYSWNGKPL